MMGVIQEKYTLADVICQHKTDGTIIPLKFASLMKTANIRFITSNPTKMYRIAQHILCPTELLLPQPTIFGNLNVRLVYLTR